MAREPGNSCIYVLAGTNGAGKSSILGAMLLDEGAEYFNPDEAARRIKSANPGLSQTDANSAAWHAGKRLLERAIRERLDFALETTLGGETIADLLHSAMASGIEVRIWYVGLSGVELHIKRVRSRAARGGHDIPDQTIRRRYDQSRFNLIRLLPELTELRVFDNSQEADPNEGSAPEPRLIVHLERGHIVTWCGPKALPEWAKPIVSAAIKLGI